MLPCVVFTHLNVGASTDSRRGATREAHAVATAGLGPEGEAGASVADDVGGRGELALGEVGDLGTGEAVDDLEDDPPGLAGIVFSLHRGDERRLAGRSAPGLSRHLRPLSAKVGIVDLDPLGQLEAAVALLHHLHELVLELPGGVVLDPEPPGELERTDAALRLRQLVHPAEPLRYGDPALLAPWAVGAIAKPEFSQYIGVRDESSPRPGQAE